MTSSKAQGITKDVRLAAGSEHGAALVMALLVLSSFGLLTAAIVFTVGTETRVSTNYKYGQQAFYVANAGIQKSLNWFRNTYVAQPPADYDTTRVPVQYNNQAVLLAGQTGSTSVYPNTSTSSSFAAALGGTQTLQTDIKNSGQYAANATLIRTQSVKFLNTTTFTLTNGALERWRLDSIGYWGTAASPMGTSEISAIVENSGSPFWGKALWARTDITLSGPSYVDSYDSSYGAYGGTNTGNNGDIGTNGASSADKITLSGSSTIFGSVYRGPSGTFSSWDTPAGSISVKGTLTNGQPKTFPTIPSFSVNTTNVTAPASITAGTYGVVKNGNSANNLTFGCGTYYIDQLVLSGGSSLTLTSGCNTTLFVKTKVDLSGGSVANPTQDPSLFQIFYPGTTQVAISGTSGFYGAVYAPNAQITLSGASNFYGSFMGNAIVITGGGSVHYDGGLKKQFLTPLPYRIITWTQKIS